MNNLNDFEMLSRALKQDRDDYLQRYEDKQDAKNEQLALTYEGLTAPFIEQSGMNILRKGLRYGAKQLGFTDEQLKTISDIGDHIKSGDLGSAINKTRSLADKNLMSEDQIRFLEDTKNRLENLKQPKDIIRSAKQTLKSDPAETITDATKNIPRIETTVEAKPNPPPLVQEDLLQPPKFNFYDPASGQVIQPKVAQPVQTSQKPVLDDDGNEIPDENEVIRNKLEDVINDPNSSDIELKQAKRGLKDLVEETRAPEPESTYQSAMDFLAGKKGTASAKWKRAPMEMDDLSNFKPDPIPTVNPRDVAPDIKIGARADYTRGQNIKIKPDVIKDDAQPPSVDNPKPIQPEPEAPEPPPVVEPTNDEIASDFGKLSQEGRMNYLNTIGGQKGVPSNLAKRTLIQVEDLNDNYESRGQYASDLDKLASKKLVTEKRKELADRFNKLSDEGQDAVKDARLKISQDATVKRVNIPTAMNEQLIEKEEQEDQAQNRGQFAPEDPKDQDDSSKGDQPEPEPEPEPKPEPEPEDDNLGSTLEKAGTEAGEIEAETGGPEDILGDIVAGGVALGTLLFGLGKSHESHSPPPLKQINPTMQEGEGQV